MLRFTNTDPVLTRNLHYDTLVTSDKEELRQLSWVITRENVIYIHGVTTRTNIVMIILKIDSNDIRKRKL